MTQMDANGMKINVGDDGLRGAFDESVKAHYQRETEDFHPGDDAHSDHFEESHEAPPRDHYDEYDYDEEFEEERPSRRPRKKKRSGPDLRPFSALELLAQEFPEPKFIVPGYVGEGLTILAGRPKIGKSWLALNIAVAVATGSLVLGSVQVEGGDVLYMALEDTRRRLQVRLKQVLDRDEVPASLHFATECPRIDEKAFERQLDDWLDSQENPRLIIIDVYTKVRPPAVSKETPYESDYRALSPLKRYADSRNVSVLIVHHTRKMSAQDPFDTISGTTGFTGAADAALVLASDEDGVTLYGRGRDVEEVSTAVEFEKKTGRWVALGDREDVRRSEPRKAIIDILRDFPSTMTIAEIADRANMKRENTKQLLHKMKHDGEVITTKPGQYTVPEYRDR